MTRPFVFRINAAELFSIVSSMPARDHSKFLKSFAHDLITLVPTIDYSAKVIQEADDYINKKRNAGSKGGKQRSSNAKALLKQKASTAQAKVKPEQNRTEKNTYAENVTMTSDEFDKLNAKYGTIFTQNCIEKLSAAKCSNDKLIYTSDYHAILKWVVDAVEKTHPSKPKYVPSLGDLI